MNGYLKLFIGLLIFLIMGVPKAKREFSTFGIFQFHMFIIGTEKGSSNGTVDKLKNLITGHSI